MAVNLLCHPFCAEFPWDPGLVGGRNLQKHAATDNNPVIFSALLAKRGEVGDVETIMRCEKGQLKLRESGYIWGVEERARDQGGEQEPFNVGKCSPSKARFQVIGIISILCAF